MADNVTTAVNEAASKGGVPNLAKAYVAARAHMGHAIKNADNPHFKSRFADLAQVLDVMESSFATHGLALFQAPGKIDGEKMDLHGTLIHESGEMLHTIMQIHVGKLTAQAVGSAISYARRYQAAAIAGIAQVDDDGNAASIVEKKAKKEAADPATAAATINAATTIGELEAVKEAVAASGDKTLIDAYRTKRRLLKETPA